ncbi:MAG: DinB family protein [Ilumatobacteraceae bacterium]
MPQEFEGDLAGAVFWGADMRGARFRDVDLTGASISHAWFVDVEIDALVQHVVINGVDVTDFVNERDPWYPLRTMLRPHDPAGMRETWALLQREWDVTITAATALPEPVQRRSVNGEWSFVETVRHLVFAMDKWVTAPVLDVGFHSSGLTNTGSRDFPFPGIDRGASPSIAEVLAVRADRSARFTELLRSSTDASLDRTVTVLENGPHPVRECIFTVFEEEFWHLRYARRDLATMS